MSDNYHSGTDHLSASGAKLILRTPLEYHSRYGPKAVEEKPKPAFRFGTAFHILVLEGEEEFRRRVTCTPDWNSLFTKPRSKAAMAERQAWREFNSDKDSDLFFSAEEYDQMMFMRDCVFAHSAAQELLKDGMAETTYRATINPSYEHGDYSVGIKAKIDWVTGIDSDDGYRLCDLKTCSDIDPKRLGADVWNYNYHLQQAFHRLVFAEFMKIPYIPSWDWIFVSKNSHDKRNYPVRVIHPTDAEETMGNHLCEKAIEIYAKCKASNEWPGPSQESEPLITPSWAKWR